MDAPAKDTLVLNKPSLGLSTYMFYEGGDWVWWGLLFTTFSRYYIVLKIRPFLLLMIRGIISTKHCQLDISIDLVSPVNAASLTAGSLMLGKGSRLSVIAGTEI